MRRTFEREEATAMTPVSARHVPMRRAGTAFAVADNGTVKGDCRQVAASDSPHGSCLPEAVGGRVFQPRYFVMRRWLSAALFCLLLPPVFGQTPSTSVSDWANR